MTDSTSTETDSDEAMLADIATLGYEQARDELTEVVRALERGGMDLDDALALWERGEALAQRCEQHLAGAHQRIEDALAHRNST